ncbi:hypothetical protein [Peribacillus sp. NPDC096540]
MDKETQEKFFQVLKNTYEVATNEEMVSIDQVIHQIKSELAPLYPKLQ